MPVVTARVRSFQPVHRKTKISRSFGRFFDRTSGFSIKLPRRNGASILIDSRLTHGRPGTQAVFMSRPRLVARVLLCKGRPWEVHTEPIGPKTFGIIVYTARGKAIGAGTGRIVGREVRYSASTLYANITNKFKITWSAGGKIKTDPNGQESYEGTIGVKVEK